MSIMILTLSLSHCSVDTMDLSNVGGGIFSGIEKKPNPIGAIKILKKKDKDGN